MNSPNPNTLDKIKSLLARGELREALEDYAKAIELDSNYIVYVLSNTEKLDSIYPQRESLKKIFSIREKLSDTIPPPPKVSRNRKMK